MENKQFAVFGLGRFGMALARTLSELGCEVLVVDKNQDLINAAASFATYAIAVDAINENDINSLGLENIDVACVCTTEMNASIMITLLCKEQGVKCVIAKSASTIHTKVLERMGADKVVFPEEDSGIQLAHRLCMTDIIDFIELSDEFGIGEFEVYPEWVDKTLLDLNFRRKWGLNIIAIRSKDGSINVSPLAEDKIKDGDTVLLVGSEDQLSKFNDRKRTINTRRHKRRKRFNQ